jgi:oligoribonuclease NrnB/cAMP/cGMP phosphodiesterase (DHH superfamily)
MKTLCIFHTNCADGFGAAWAVRHALGAENVEFFAGKHQESPPDVTGRDVVIVDFSYPRAVLDSMFGQARSLIVLDHHKTAADALAGIAPPPPWDGGFHEGTYGALFDMARSGAGLAWDFFHPGRPRPDLINHIEDRDLWRFALPFTREISAALFSYPYDFHIWDGIVLSGTAGLVDDGMAIERKHHKDVEELVKVCRRRMAIDGYDVPVASLPNTLASDAGHLMAKGEPFAGTYYDTETHRVFSLRSTEDGVDVQNIAKNYGGGGHMRAAGFKVPRDHGLARS